MSNYLIALIVVWVVCGIVSIVNKSNKPLDEAAGFTILLGIFYILMHHK